MNIVFIETPEFIKKIDAISSTKEILNLQLELIADPLKGKIIKGTGGARKIRMKIGGRGKSAGARTIYYYTDLRGEIWLLEVFLKKDKSGLNANEKNKIKKFIKEVINAEE